MSKFIARLIGFGVLFIAVNQLIGAYIGGKRNLSGFYPAIRWEEFYNQDTNTIDMLFLGSSHCYRTFIPNKFDSAFNINSFNLGSSGQTPSNSYFTLKEALYTQSPSTVILEINHNSFKSSKNITKAEINYNYYKSFSNKMDAIIHTVPLSNIMEVVFPTYHYNNLKSLLFRTSKDQYAKDKNIHSYYSHKGYVETPFYEQETSIISTYTSVDTLSFIRTEIKYFTKIIEECKKNNIELILVTQPYNPAYANSKSNIDVFDSFIKSRISDKNIIYFNGNSEEILEQFTSNDFYDHSHLFKNGAKKFNDLVINRIKSKD